MYKPTRSLCLTLALLVILLGGAPPYVARAETAMLTSIVITPQNPTMYVGQRITFTAQGYDQNGNLMPIPDPWWEGWKGTITPDPVNPSQATFTATEAGDDAYIACWNGQGHAGLHGSTDILIQPAAPVARIEVTPAEITLQPGEQQQFTATGYDEQGNQTPITPLWSTACGCGEIAPVGLFTACAEGDFVITAGIEGSALTGAAVVHVVAEQTGEAQPGGKQAVTTCDCACDCTFPILLLLLPALLILLLALAILLVALAKLWRLKEHQNSQPEKKGNRITPAILCLLLALTAMFVGGVSTRTALAETAVLTSIVITPDSPALCVGQSITFTAQGYDQNGNPMTIPDPRWSGAGGTITPDPADPSRTTYTATEAGQGGIGCWNGPGYAGVHDSMDFMISQGTLVTRIDLLPADITLQAGQQQQFTATGYDEQGNLVTITPAWSTVCGEISSGGLYTACTAGDFTVTASAACSTGTGAATIHVTGGQDEISQPVTSCDCQCDSACPASLTVLALALLLIALAILVVAVTILWRLRNRREKAEQEHASRN